MTATFHVGDAIEVMNTLPEKSVDLVLTSPPFLALRSYLPADHPDKALEGGSQATPGEYVDWLLDVVEACARVLAPHGSLCFELGDTYSGHDNRGSGEDNGHFDAKTRTVQTGIGWPLAKSLSLIPETFRFAMVYGYNPHTGRRTDPWRLRNVIRWVRPNPPVGALGDKFRPATSELMVFCKAKDRFFDLDATREALKQPESEGHSRMGGAKYQGTPGDGLSGGTQTGMARYEVNRSNPAGAPPLDWWNIPLLDGEEPTPLWWCEEHGERGGDPTDARCWVSETGPEECRLVKRHLLPSEAWNVPLLEGEEETRYGPKEKPAITPRDGSPKVQQGQESGSLGQSGVYVSMVNRTYNKDGGAPPLDWWNIPPGGYAGAHYAVWPPELLIKPIKAMCPEKVCVTCGEASRRIVGEAEYVPSASYRGGHTNLAESNRVLDGAGHVNQFIDNGAGRASVVRQAATLGFSDCGHDDWRPGLVLDCFGGTGTTAVVATGHGRDCILIDLDERNYDLALERVGPFILTKGEVPVPCETCGGAGKVPCESREGRYDQPHSLVDCNNPQLCPACHGRGWTYPEETQ